jgi:hypothetical protein
MLFKDFIKNQVSSHQGLYAGKPHIKGPFKEIFDNINVLCDSMSTTASFETNNEEILLTLWGKSKKLEN